MIHIVKELRRGVIEVVIDYIRADALDRSCGNQLEVGIFCLDRFVELGEAAIIGPAAVVVIFISNLDIGQVERCCMAIPRPFGAPWGARAAGYILDFIQSLRDKRLQILPRLHILLPQ